MKSQLNVLFDGLNELNAIKKAREINSFSEHAISYHILPFDLDFRIRKKSVMLNSIK